MRFLITLILTTLLFTVTVASPNATANGYVPEPYQNSAPLQPTPDNPWASLVGAPASAYPGGGNGGVGFNCYNWPEQFWAERISICSADPTWIVPEMGGWSPYLDRSF